MDGSLRDDLFLEKNIALLFNIELVKGIDLGVREGQKKQEENFASKGEVWGKGWEGKLT